MVFEQRDGEVTLAQNPAELPGDAHLVFIGTVSSPWKSRKDCPKNMRQARERGQTAAIEIASPYRPGLSGLEANNPIVLLSWFGHAPRNLIVQRPRHAGEPRGTFALRSPVRPNPVGLHVVKLLAIEKDKGLLTIDAIDLLDQTAIIDIKPWYASTDIIEP